MKASIVDQKLDLEDEFINSNLLARQDGTGYINHNKKRSSQV